MANDAVNISVPLRYEVKSAPVGTTDYDIKALSANQQRELNIYKINIKKEDIVYFSNHPEIRAIVSWIVRMTVIHHPRNITEFIANLFTLPEREIKAEIKKILNESIDEYTRIKSSDYDEWDY